ADVDAEFLRRTLRALGLPPVEDEPAYHDADVESAGRLRQYQAAGLTDEAIVEASRVLGMALSQVAQAVRTVVAESLLRPGDTERDLGLRLAALARGLIPLFGPQLEWIFAEHLREL